MNYKITPKNLILSIMHVSNNQPMPIKLMISYGKFFGFTSNTIRVAVTRLLRENSIVSDERGFYHLSKRLRPVSKIIDSWQMGESRIKKWNKKWICCLLPKDTAAKLSKNKKALDFSGFKEGLPGLWVRPDNLWLNIPDICKVMDQIGLTKDAEFFISEQFNKKIVGRWMKFLWPVEDLNNSLIDITKKLEESYIKIQSMPLEDAMRESYLYGGEAVNRLIKDPLLPEEIMEKKHRVALTNSMLGYDEVGKKIWQENFQWDNFEQCPSYLRLVPTGGKK